MLRDEETEVDDKQMDQGINVVVVESDPKTLGASSKTDTEGFALRSAGENVVLNVLDPSSIDWKIVDLNAQTKDGSTALHVAVVARDLEAVKLLLRRGADPYARDHDGQTPLHKAVSDSWKINDPHDPELPIAANAIFNVLLDNVEDVDLKDNNGMTTLCIAMRQVDVNAVESLLRHDCDIIQISSAYIQKVINCFREVSERWRLIVLTGLDSRQERGVLISRSPDISKYCTAINECVRRHVIMVMALGLRFCKETRTFFYAIAGGKVSTLECILLGKYKEEVDIMKVQRIGNSNVTFYEYLMKTIHQLAMTLRNRIVMETLEAAHYKDAFKLYSTMIDSRFRKAKKRMYLIDSSLILLNYLSGCVLGDYDSMEILSYLSNRDLENFIKSSPLAKENVSTKLNKKRFRMQIMHNEKLIKAKS